MDPLNEGHRAYQSLSDSLDNNLYTHTKEMPSPVQKAGNIPATQETMPADCTKIRKSYAMTVDC